MKFIDSMGGVFLGEPSFSQMSVRAPAVYFAICLCFFGHCSTFMPLRLILEKHSSSLTKCKWSLAMFQGTQTRCGTTPTEAEGNHRRHFSPRPISGHDYLSLDTSWTDICCFQILVQNFTICVAIQPFDKNILLFSARFNTDFAPRNSCHNLGLTIETIMCPNRNIR